MKLIHQLFILLLINFAACSTEKDDPCYDEYTKQGDCYRKIPNGDHIFRDLNATDGDTDMLRTEINRYCESGLKYLQCFEDITLTAQCQKSDLVDDINQVFVDKIIKFGIEYFCRNDGEAVFKIAANNGVKSILKLETVETIGGCFPDIKSSDHRTPISELFCRDVDAVSDCLLESSDKMANKDISGIIRDVVPQLKVIGNCAAAA